MWQCWAAAATSFRFGPFAFVCFRHFCHFVYVESGFSVLNAQTVRESTENYVSSAIKYSYLFFPIQTSDCRLQSWWLLLPNNPLFKIALIGNLSSRKKKKELQRIRCNRSSLHIRKRFSVHTLAMEEERTRNNRYDFLLHRKVHHCVIYIFVAVFGAAAQKNRLLMIQSPE